MFVDKSFSARKVHSARPVYLIDHILIIRALILRNLRLKHGHRPMGFFAEFLRPTVIDVTHYYIFSAMGKPMPGGIPVEEFVWAGFAVWMTFTGIWMPIKGSRAAPAVPFPGVSAMHMRIAICAWPVMINSVFVYGSFALMMLFGDNNIVFPNVPLFGLILVITAVFGMGMGLVIGAACRVAPMIDPFLHILPWFMLIGSGIYGSITSSPRYLQEILVWSPPLHLVEYARYAFDPGYPTSLVNLWYPSLWAIGLMLLGLSLTKRYR
jgi:ABC-type polysaccharide/polyol phosphate export permease